MICWVNDKIHLSDDTMHYLTPDRRQLMNVVKMTSRCLFTWWHESTTLQLSKVT